MKIKKSIFAIILFYIILISCKSYFNVNKNNNSNKSNDYNHDNHLKSEEFTVITSDDFIRNIIEVIAGKKIKVNSILDPGEISYCKGLSRQEKKMIIESGLYLYNGLGICKDTKKFLERNKKKINSFDITAGIDPNKFIKSGKYNSGYDPHIWFDAELWILVCRNVTKILVKLDPDMEMKYRDHLTLHCETLSMMNGYIAQGIFGIPHKNRNLITVNKSFDYLVRKYDFKTYCLNDLMINDEIDYKKLGELADVIIEKKIPGIFTEMYFDDTVVNELNRILLEKDYNIKIGTGLYSYSLGEPGKREYFYVNALRKNIDIIYNTLYY